MRHCSSLEPRLSILDFVFQFWRKISCETKSGMESLGSRLAVFCHGKNAPPPKKKIGTPQNLFYCKIWTPSEKNIDPQHISLAKFGPLAYLRGFQCFWKLLRPVSLAARNVLYSHSHPPCNTQYLHTLCYVCNQRTFRTLCGVVSEPDPR